VPFFCSGLAVVVLLLADGRIYRTYAANSGSARWVFAGGERRRGSAAR
jgi:hypothetical protein